MSVFIHPLAEPREGRRHTGPGFLVHSPLAPAAGSQIHRSADARTCPHLPKPGQRLAWGGGASQIQELPLPSPQLGLSKNLNNNRACCNYLKKGHTFFPSLPIQKYLNSENKSQSSLAKDKQAYIKPATPSPALQMGQAWVWVGLSHVSTAQSPSCSFPQNFLELCHCHEDGLGHGRSLTVQYAWVKDSM